MSRRIDEIEAQVILADVNATEDVVAALQISDPREDESMALRNPDKVMWVGHLRLHMSQVASLKDLELLKAELAAYQGRIILYGIFAVTKKA